MKKFLTVLLALSVVFTYTVGTAFAADPVTYTLSDVESAINSQVITVNGQIDAAKAYLLSQFTAKTIDATAGSAVISKATFESVLNQMAAAEKTKAQTNASYAILAARKAAAADAFTAFSESDKTGYVGDVTTAETYSSLSLTTVVVATAYDSINALVTDLNLGKTEFVKVKAEALAKVNSLALNNYSQVIPSDGAKSNYTLASEAQKTAKDALDALTVADTTTKSAVYADAIQGVAAALVTFDDAIKGITTIAQEDAATADLKTIKGYAIAKLQADANVAYQTALAALQNQLIGLERAEKPDATAIAEKKAEIAGLKANYDAFVQVETYKINALTSKGAILNESNQVKLSWTIDTSATTLAAAKIDNIAKLEAEAKLVAMYTDANGEVLYAQQTIDSKLAAAIDTTYNASSVAGFAATLGLTADDTAEKALAARKVELQGSGTVYVNKIAYKGIAGWTPAASTTNYFDAQMAAAKEIAQQTKDAIEAAKTILEAETALIAGYTKYDAIQTKADQDAFFAIGGTLKASYDKYVSDINAYVEYKFAQLGTEAVSKLAVTKDTLKSKLALDIKGEAYTASDLATNYNDAVAVVDGLSTKDTIEAEAKALNDRILAVNPKVTVSDKTVVSQLKKDVAAFEEYNTKVGYTCTTVINKTLLNSYAAAIQTAEAKAITDAYALINAKTITTADKPAVEALRAARDAYYEEYAQEPSVTVTDSTIKLIEGKLQDAFVIAVVGMINGLPADITAADKATVEAARAAYDALPAAKQTAVKNLALLVKAEASLKLAVELKNAEIAGGVKATTISLATSVSTKGIKLTWKKSFGYKVDAYKVYRKVAGGTYKLYKTTTKTTFLNSKVTKGKKYTYKVVGVRNVGDKTVQTRYSKVITRTAK